MRCSRHHAASTIRVWVWASLLGDGEYTMVPVEEDFNLISLCAACYQQGESPSGGEEIMDEDKTIGGIQSMQQVWCHGSEFQSNVYLTLMS